MSDSKDIIFFWFKESEFVTDDQLSQVTLRVRTENQEMTIPLILDEVSDVFESEPTPIPIGIHGGTLVIGDSAHTLNEFEVFKNRNRVVCKINPEIEAVPASEDVVPAPELQLSEDEPSYESSEGNQSQSEEVASSDEAESTPRTETSQPAAETKSDEVDAVVNKYSRKEEQDSADDELDDASRETPDERMTPSTVIDRKDESSESVSRKAMEDERISELEAALSDLQRVCNQKDNELLKLKTDLLEAQRVNRSLQGDPDALKSLDSELIRELKEENQRLRVQLDVASEQQPNNKLEARYALLFEELEVQKKLVEQLQAENQHLSAKLDSLTEAANQEAAFTPIEEETEESRSAAPVEASQSQPSLQQASQSQPSLQQANGTVNGPQTPSEHTAPSENVPSTQRQQPVSAQNQQEYSGAAQKQMGPSSPQKQQDTYITSANAGRSRYDDGERRAAAWSEGGGGDPFSAGSDAQLAYTKTNICFLKERLADLRDHNRDLHDRYLRLEDASSGSRVASRGTDLDFHQLNGSREDRINAAVSGLEPADRERFISQKRAALSELEEIRVNLASVKAELNAGGGGSDLLTRNFDGLKGHETQTGGRLKKPSELFGSLGAQINNSSYSGSPAWNSGSRPNDQPVYSARASYPQKIYSHQSSTADTVVERANDKLEAGDSDSTEVLIATNARLDPSYHLPRDDSRGKRRAGGGQRQLRRQPSPDSEDTLTDNEGTMTPRSPNAVFEERLNRSYPSLASKLHLSLADDVWDAIDNGGGLERSSGVGGYVDLKKRIQYANAAASAQLKRERVPSAPPRHPQSAAGGGGQGKGGGGHLRFYVPRTAGDVCLGDSVKFSKKGGRVSHGVIHFSGRLPGRDDFYLGVELDSGHGKHDGMFHGNRFFHCAPRRGVFVSFKKIILCYGPI